MANLARAFFRRDPVGSRRNIILARYGFEQAIEIYATRQMHDEFADILSDLGRLHSRLGVIGDHAEPRRRHRVLLRRPADLHTLQTHPLEWAEETFNLADVYRATAALTRNDEALREAESRNAAVVTAISSDYRIKIGAAKIMEPDGQLRMGSANKLLGFAIKELQYIDRTGIPEPRTRAGFERKTLGTVLFLRPMITSRNLILENRFSDPQDFALRFEVEPTVVPLESALYRALNEKFAFQTVGGTPGRAWARGATTVSAARDGKNLVAS